MSSPRPLGVRRVRWRGRRQGRATLVIALIAGALLASLMVSERAAGQSLAHAATTPAALFGAFVKLDRKLTRAIDRAEKGESSSTLIDQIERGKLAIVDDQMQ